MGYHGPWLTYHKAWGICGATTQNNDAYHVSPIPDMYGYIISLGHAVLMIMAMDGLWNAFSHKETVSYARTYLLPE